MVNQKGRGQLKIFHAEKNYPCLISRPATDGADPVSELCQIKHSNTQVTWSEESGLLKRACRKYLPFELDPMPWVSLIHCLSTSHSIFGLLALGGSVIMVKVERNYNLLSMQR